MHPGLFLLAITFNSIPPLCWEAELMHIRWADSCYSSSCLSIACECCWFMFSQVPHFFMPGKLPDETHQMLCALKLSQRDKTPKTTIRPRQVPRVTCQSLHLQHKSSEVCFWGFIVHLFMLNKTGGCFLINISKNTPGNQHRGGLRYVYLNLNNKKADDTQKELFLLLEEISQHLRGKMSTAPVPEKKWGKVCEEKSFLVTAVGDRRALQLCQVLERRSLMWDPGWDPVVAALHCHHEEPGAGAGDQPQSHHPQRAPWILPGVCTYEAPVRVHWPWGKAGGTFHLEVSVPKKETFGERTPTHALQAVPQHLTARSNILIWRLSLSKINDAPPALERIFNNLFSWRSAVYWKCF